MGRRLTAIETAIAAEPRACPTVRSGPSFFVRFRGLDGTIKNNRADGWPAEEVPTCPGCGRTCEKVDHVQL